MNTILVKSIPNPDWSGYYGYRYRKARYFINLLAAANLPLWGSVFKRAERS